VAALVVPNVALGVIVGRLFLCTLAAVPLMLLTIVASFQSGPDWFLALVVGGLAAGTAIVIALGVGLSWLIARVRPPWRDTSRAVFAGLLLATAPGGRGAESSSCRSRLESRRCSRPARSLAAAHSVASALG